MDRDIETDLLAWKQQAHHMPILLRGARQVGKSYVAEKFGQQHFENCVVVNFELQPELKNCFHSLQPTDILQQLTLLLHQPVTPGKTLLFLDEIQDCPNAIMALRYFEEKMPTLHVIAAGSLLEFTLNSADFRMPVGRVQSLYLKPLSFKEYLSAVGFADLRHYIEQVDMHHTIPDPIHQELLKQVRIYLGLGGMPKVLNAFLESEKTDLNRCRMHQSTILHNYRQDFGKYATHIQIPALQKVFEKAPGFVGSHFKYTKVDPEAKIQQIKTALTLLQYAGLIYPVYSTAATGLPLITLVNEKKFKILFVDVGLMVYASGAEAALLMENFIFVNRGAIAEQFVGQELLAYAPTYEEARTYFWCREKKSSMAEVDFIITVDGKIIPIEVKAGTTGQLKSLQLFLHEQASPLGIRISHRPLGREGNILSIPIYMVSEIARCVRNFLDSSVY